MICQWHGSRTAKRIPHAKTGQTTLKAWCSFTPQNENFEWRNKVSSHNLHASSQARTREFPWCNNKLIPASNHIQRNNRELWKAKLLCKMVHPLYLHFCIIVQACHCVVGYCTYGCHIWWGPCTKLFVVTTSCLSPANFISAGIWLFHLA